MQNLFCAGKNTNKKQHNGQLGTPVPCPYTTSRGTVLCIASGPSNVTPHIWETDYVSRITGDLSEDKKFDSAVSRIIQIDKKFDSAIGRILQIDKKFDSAVGRIL
jgi:hypothetical protein